MAATLSQLKQSLSSAGDFVPAGDCVSGLIVLACQFSTGLSACDSHMHENIVLKKALPIPSSNLPTDFYYPRILNEKSSI